MLEFLLAAYLFVQKGPPPAPATPPAAMCASVTQVEGQLRARLGSIGEARVISGAAAQEIANRASQRYQQERIEADEVRVWPVQGANAMAIAVFNHGCMQGMGILTPDAITELLGPSI